MKNLRKYCFQNSFYQLLQHYAKGDYFLNLLVYVSLLPKVPNKTLHAFISNQFAYFVFLKKIRSFVCAISFFSYFLFSGIICILKGT